MVSKRGFREFLSLVKLQLQNDWDDIREYVIGKLRRHG
jgi:hypothetical protein